MKKLVLLLAVAFSVSMFSCGGSNQKAEADTTATDTTVVVAEVVDTTATDSAAVDSNAVDTTATVAE